MKRWIKSLFNVLLVCGVLAGFWWVAGEVAKFEDYGYRTETYETKRNLQRFGVPDWLKKGDRVHD